MLPPIVQQLRVGLGYRPDPDSHRATPLRRLLGYNLSSPPPSATCRLWTPPFRNQLKTQSCVGHALRTAVAASLAQQGCPLDFDSSPVAIYDGARCIDRVVSADGTLPALMDFGSEPNEALRGLQEWGLCPYELRPTDNTTINEEPTFLELAAGKGRHIYGGYKATGDADSIARQVMETIAFKRSCVCVAIPVDQALMDYDGMDPIQAVNHNAILGWHYVCVVGYETLSTGEVVWEFANSWAPWGNDGGYGRGGQGWQRGWQDAMVVDIRMAG